MENSIKYTIEVEFIPGSKFQKDFLWKYLKALTDAVYDFFSGSHKGNRIKTSLKSSELVDKREENGKTKS
jgi:hypothetical protein